MKKATMNKALFGLVAFVAILFMGVTVTSCSNGDEVQEEKKEQAKGIEEK